MYIKNYLDYLYLGLRFLYNKGILKMLKNTNQNNKKNNQKNLTRNLIKKKKKNKKLKILKEN